MKKIWVLLMVSLLLLLSGCGSSKKEVSDEGGETGGETAVVDPVVEPVVVPLTKKLICTQEEDGLKVSVIFTGEKPVESIRMEMEGSAEELGVDESSLEYMKDIMISSLAEEFPGATVDIVLINDGADVLISIDMPVDASLDSMMGGYTAEELKTLTLEEIALTSKTAGATCEIQK
ncbi:MAG: hypothetical protein LBR25_02235 [Erysipelotrichaceae bacterium]|jgi:hypothetical protein|nr:hypothetical protein [Erysipelotrichaceae bacterium]